MNIYYGGPILTLDPARPRVEALLTADNIIAALGNLEDLKALAPEAELVSLEGRTLMPGFVDGHSHLAMTGSYFNRCDLFGCTSDYLLGRSASPLPVISPEDAAVLDAYHALPLEIRKAVDGLLAPYRTAASEKRDA
jgi:hypothetical protein